MESLEEELPSDNGADEGKWISATHREFGTGSADLCFRDGIADMPLSKDGAADAWVIDASGSAEDKAAVRCGAASPPEETPATVKKSKLKVKIKLYYTIWKGTCGYLLFEYN